MTEPFSFAIFPRRCFWKHQSPRLFGKVDLEAGVRCHVVSTVTIAFAPLVTIDSRKQPPKASRWWGLEEEQIEDLRVASENEKQREISPECVGLTLQRKKQLQR